MSTINITNILRDVGFALKPDFIVGCRYRFGTVINGEPFEIEGIIKHFLFKESGTVHYDISAPSNLVVKVCGLAKVGRDTWLLKVTGGETFLISLEGNFTLV